MKTNKIQQQVITPAPFETIIITRDDIWEITSSVARDMIQDESWSDAKEMLTKCIDALRFPATMLSWLREGNGVFALGVHTERVEKFVKDKKPFVVVVMSRDGSVYATVNGKDFKF